MFKLFKYLKPYTLAIIAIFILTIVQVFTYLQLPDYMAKIVNQGIVLGNSHLIWTTGLFMVLVTLLGGVCAIGVGFLSAKTSTGFATDLRLRVFKKVESFSKAELDKFSTASLITRSTNDIQQIQFVMILLLSLVLMAPLMGFGAIIKAYAMAPSMSWIIALGVVSILAVVSVFFSVGLPKYQIMQKLIDRLNLVTRENLTGLRVIRAFNRETYEQNKFEKANQDLTSTNLFINRLMSGVQPSMMLIFYFTAILIIWVGAHYVSTKGLQIGSMIAFMQYAIQVVTSFLMISFIFIFLPRAAVCGQRIQQVLRTDPAIQNPASPAQLTDAERVTIDFQHVSFAYGGADDNVLTDISFQARPGETTAIVGSTGSGKSTLIDLILRFYDPTVGQILINGLDIRDLNMSDLRNLLGFVSQRSVLFSGTVESNIAYGQQGQVSEEAIHRAARIAQADGFISKLKEHYQAPIAQEGANVSGGQKQRLAIARALVKKPPVYLFDDSFSSLDFTTDAALRRALEPETKNSTVLIVAQRISTIMHAQKIIVLDQGQIVGVGTHNQLMKSCPVYREIAESQLSTAELSSVSEELKRPTRGTTKVEPA